VNASTRSVAVLGGSGYVAGELIRLIAGHPGLELAAVSSTTLADTPVAACFPNLAGCLAGMCFVTPEALGDRVGDGEFDGLFCAAPHGVAAGLLAGMLPADPTAGPAVVDASADFRFRDAASYEAVYGHAHGAPALIERFGCAVPEHLEDAPGRWMAHPGCFATATLLAVVPLLASGLAEPEFFVAGVTGSTGSGNKPVATTHHPERHANLFSYRPLRHRHAPEMESLAAAAAGTAPRIRFVPHSGPFARGIHVTVQGRLRKATNAEGLRATLASAYAHSPFVEIVPGEPRVKDVTGSNRARLGAASDGDSYVVMCVIDNLVKGAAGGALQWMNRLLGLDEATGLTLPGPAWI
jgi:N-acetyl-gamma-glutamyl-phosphate reductase common form